MQIKYFDFPLPEDSIAYYPWWCRSQMESAKMLVVDKQTGTIEDRRVEDLLTILNPSDAVVTNNTKAYASAYHGVCVKHDARNKKKVDKIQLLFTRKIKSNKNQTLYEFLIFPSRILREGTQINIGKAVFYIIDSTVNKGKVLSSSMDPEFVEKELEKNKIPVLPQYIKRDVEKGDEKTLDHFLATQEGSITPSSANMLIAPKLYKQLILNSFTLPQITNHINIGCYTDYRNKELNMAEYDSQKSVIDQDNADLLSQCKGKVISVGINTLKTLEESVSYNGLYRPHNKYIAPNFMPGEYKFKGSQGLLTGLHIPKSQYLVIASAFTGYEIIMRAYKHAIQNDYKFGMYGDAMLII